MGFIIKVVYQVFSFLDLVGSGGTGFQQIIMLIQIYIVWWDENKEKISRLLKRYFGFNSGFKYYTISVWKCSGVHLDGSFPNCSCIIV